MLLVEKQNTQNPPFPFFVEYIFLFLFSEIKYLFGWLTWQFSGLGRDHTQSGALTKLQHSPFIFNKHPPLHFCCSGCHHSRHPNPLKFVPWLKFRLAQLFDRCDLSHAAAANRNLTQVERSEKRSMTSQNRSRSVHSVRLPLWWDLRRSIKFGVNAALMFPNVTF